GRQHQVGLRDHGGSQRYRRVHGRERRQGAQDSGLASNPRRVHEMADVRSTLLGVLILNEAARHSIPVVAQYKGVAEPVTPPYKAVQKAAPSTLTLSRTPESDNIGALGSGNGSRCRPVGGTAMPVYEYHCDKCQRAVTLPLSIREHEKGEFTCPPCG